MNDKKRASWSALGAWTRGAVLRPEPCTCGELPDVKIGFAGWTVECSKCGVRTSGWSDPNDAIREWDRKIKNRKGGDKNGKEEAQTGI